MESLKIILFFSLKDLKSGMRFVTSGNMKLMKTKTFLTVLSIILLFFLFNILSAKEKQPLTGENFREILSDLVSPDTLIMTGGEIGFDYKPYFSFDTYHYSVSGTWDTSFQFEDTTEMVGGTIFTIQDTTVLGFFGLHYFPSDSDTSADMVAYFIASDTSITPGAYPLDITSDSAPSMFIFLLGIDSIAIPTNFDSLDFSNFTDFISADTMIMGTSGEFTFNEISDSEINGIFDVEGADAMNPMFYSIFNGYFTINQPLVPVSLQNEVYSPPQQIHITNYPNPFNSSTIFHLDIPSDIQEVEVNIFDVKGRLVKSFFFKHPPGNLTFSWYPQGLSSGVYIYDISLLRDNGAIDHIKGKTLLIK